MKNTIDFTAVTDAIYALSSLKNIINDPTLPGPLGRNEEEALLALSQRMFRELCTDIGASPTDSGSVELACDCHDLLQTIVTDRTLAELTLRSPRSELLRRLKCRLRPRPPKKAHRY